MMNKKMRFVEKIKMRRNLKVFTIKKHVTKNVTFQKKRKIIIKMLIKSDDKIVSLKIKNKMVQNSFP